MRILAWPKPGFPCSIFFVGMFFLALQAQAQKPVQWVRGYEYTPYADFMGLDPTLEIEVGFDRKGRRVEQRLLEKGVFLEKTNWEYDTKGRQSIYHRVDSSGETIAMDKYKYDPKGRLQEERLLDEHGRLGARIPRKLETFVWYLESWEDLQQAINAKEFEYDAARKTLQTWKPSTNLEQAKMLEMYEYNPQGQLVQLTEYDEKSGKQSYQTIWEYDVLGRLVASFEPTYPRKTTYEYDSKHRVLHAFIITRKATQLPRPSPIYKPSPWDMPIQDQGYMLQIEILPTDTITLEYTYDERDSLAAIHRLEPPHSEIHETKTLVEWYETIEVGDTLFRVRRTADQSGQYWIWRRAYVGGRIVQNCPYYAVCKDYSYNANGQVVQTKMIYGDAITDRTLYDYDPQGRLTSECSFRAEGDFQGCIDYRYPSPGVRIVERSPRVFETKREYRLEYWE